MSGRVRGEFHELRRAIMLCVLYQWWITLGAGVDDDWRFRTTPERIKRMAMVMWIADNIELRSMT